MNIFKVHCSQISKIMGRIGLTDIQTVRLSELENKPSLTKNQQEEMLKLQIKRDNPELPDTCTTHLKEWYSGERADMHSKYLDKGNYVEPELIEFACDTLGIPRIAKNIVTKEDEYMEGTCDVDYEPLDLIIDVKAPWNIKTLNDNVSGMNADYDWQGVGYMHLYNRSKFILFYGLMDTPEDANYGLEVIYSDLPIDQRWLAYQISAQPERVKQIQERVILCRAWLDKYDQEVRAVKGRVNVL